MSFDQNFKAIIFDMDGLMIDSEALWRVAESSVFGSYGLVLSETDCLETTGLRIDELVLYWAERHPELCLPVKRVESEILEKVTALIEERGKLNVGVREVLSWCTEWRVATAIASSSPRKLISAVTEIFSLTGEFDAVASAEDEEFGKPHPAVYLTAAGLLGVEPASCVALEDSENGARSAKSAGMFCVVVPEQMPASANITSIADVVFPDLLKFKSGILDLR